MCERRLRRPASRRRLRLLLGLAALLAACALPAAGASGAVTQIGGPGVGPGTFEVPGAVAADSAGDVYVLDPVGDTVQEFSASGALLADKSSPDGEPLADAQGIAIGAGGNVLVAATCETFPKCKPGLIELNSSLEYIKTVVSGAFVSVAVEGGHIYALAVSGTEYEVERFTEAGALEQPRKFPDGSGAGDLAEPNKNGAIHDQIAVDSGGTVYISDADNQRVVELEGATLDPLGPTLTGLGGYAQGIATGEVGGQTQVYVGDDNYSGTAFVRRYSPSGAQLGSLAVPGAHGGLASEEGEVFDSEGFAGGGVLRIDTAPDPAIAATPATGLSSQTVTFDGSGSVADLWGVQEFRWDLSGTGEFVTSTGAMPTVTRQFNTPGTYPVGLEVTASNGRAASATIDYTVGASSAAFTNPAQILTGQAVTFNGAPSTLPYSTVADYAWDFDGSSSYAVDGGASPTVSHTFATPGTYTVQLRVTRAGGRMDSVAAAIQVAPAPPAGAVGVLIDEGDYATDSPHVEIGLVWPAGATQALVSNNGGFGASGHATTRPLAAEVPWTLEQTGAERLPKTVYVRFLGAGIDLDNFTDDIILDQRPPELQSAQLLGSGAGAAAARSHARTYSLRIRARDSLVGVCAVAVSSRRSGGKLTTLTSCRRKGITRLFRVVRVGSSGRPRYVRVRNSAGDWSRWRAL